jgi:hypothetical protein
MKKYLLGAVFFLMSTVFAFSGPIEIYNYQDTVLGSLFWDDIDGIYKSDDLIAYAQIRNVSDASISFNLSIECLELTPNHAAAVCWFQCFEFTDGFFLSPETYTFESKQESIPGQFAGHLQPYKIISHDPLIYSAAVPGTSKIRYTFAPTTGGVEDILNYDVVFVVSLPTSVEDKFNYTLKTFPNPANENLTVDLGESYSENVLATIYDLSGNVVKTFDIQHGETLKTISINELSSGSYRLNLRKGNLLRTKSFNVVR